MQTDSNSSDKCRDEDYCQTTGEAEGRSKTFLVYSTDKTKKYQLIDMASQPAQKYQLIDMASQPAQKYQLIDMASQPAQKYQLVYHPTGSLWDPGPNNVIRPKPNGRVRPTVMF